MDTSLNIPQENSNAYNAQHNLAYIMPTASEIGYLWSSYLAETIAVCFLKYFLAKSKDPDIKPVFQYALDVSSQRVKAIQNIYNSLDHPIPEAFGEKDVDVNARELFSETYLLHYTRLTNKFILVNYSKAFSMSSRKDIQNFFDECINTVREVYRKATNVLTAKGLLLKSPKIPIPDSISYVHKENYYGSFLKKSDRPLNALEINNIFEIIVSKMILKTLNMGLSQAAKDPDVRSHLIRGEEITEKQVKELSAFLEKEDLPVPMSSDFEVTVSTEAPFSDKLMMFHISVVKGYAISNYGLALTNTTRKDVAAAIYRLILELIHFSKDGTDIMIDKSWLERVPQAADRDELIH